MHFDRDYSFVHPFDSFIQQSHTLKKVQYLADTVVDLMTSIVYITH